MMKKVFFKQRNLEIGECNGIKLESCRNLFPPEKISAQTQGMKKNEIMKFLGFSKIWDENSLQIIFLEKKKKSERNIFQEFLLQILENPKNFMISFFHPLNLSGVVLGENLSRSFFSPLQRFVGKKCFNNFHFLRTPSKTFPSIYSQTSPNPIPDQSQFRQSLPLKTKIQFYQNFLPAKRSANHSMFFRRL